MRQTGILAAFGILALTEMTGRLEEDHKNARYLAQMLCEIPGVTVDVDSVQINMVFSTFAWPKLEKLPEWLKQRGVIIGGYMGPEIRFVTHYGITKRTWSN